jgi:xylulokinase
MVMGVQSPEYAHDDAFRTLAGVPTGEYTLETVLNAAAYLATWTRERFGGAQVTVADMEAAAAQVPPGAEGLLVLPYWNAAQTPYWDPLARGAVVGWHGRHTPAHLYRAVLEGVAFELRLHLERLEAATGRPVEHIRAVGGGARSELWVRIVADVVQRPVRVCSAGEVSAAGAALLAHGFLAGGGPAAVVEPAGVDVVPDPTAGTAYARLAEVHGRLYPALRDVFADLSTLA